VSRTIYAQAVAREMFGSHVLELSEFQSITKMRRKPIQAAKELLDAVIKRPDDVCYQFFLKALSDTGHERVRLLIERRNIQGTQHGCSCTLP